MTNKSLLLQKRFKKIGMYHKWTHFITITYDTSKILSDDEFVKRLKQVFSRYVTRQGWKVLGVFETGSSSDSSGASGRMHFHGVVSIPEGKMMGELNTIECSVDGNKSRKNKVHSYFYEQFGMNNFELLWPTGWSQLGDVMRFLSYGTNPSGYSFFFSRGLYGKENQLRKEFEKWFLAEVECTGLGTVECEFQASCFVCERFNNAFEAWKTEKGLC